METLEPKWLGLRAVLQVPRVEWEMQLAAQVALQGAQLVPEKHWARLAHWLEYSVLREPGNKLLDHDTELPKPWVYHENHARSEQHDMAACQVVERLAKEKKAGDQVWFIPVDELLLQPGEQLEGISMTRLFMVGTAGEMDEAVDFLVSTLEAATILEP